MDSANLQVDSPFVIMAALCQISVCELGTCDFRYHTGPQRDIQFGRPNGLVVLSNTTKSFSCGSNLTLAGRLSLLAKTNKKRNQLLIAPSIVTRSKSMLVDEGR